MDVTVQVLDGQVTDVDGTEMDRDGLRSLLGAEPTVEGLFTFLGEAEQKADQIDVEFDDATGVPQRIDIDYITNAIDDELSIEISGFRPGAPTAD
jgi:hypothetical protein